MASEYGQSLEEFCIVRMIYPLYSTLAWMCECVTLPFTSACLRPMAHI